MNNKFSTTYLKVLRDYHVELAGDLEEEDRAHQLVVDLCDYILSLREPEVDLDKDFILTDEFLTNFDEHARQANELFDEAFSPDIRNLK